MFAPQWGTKLKPHCNVSTAQINAATICGTISHDSWKTRRDLGTFSIAAYLARYLSLPLASSLPLSLWHLAPLINIKLVVTVSINASRVAPTIATGLAKGQGKNHEATTPRFPRLCSTDPAIPCGSDGARCTIDVLKQLQQTWGLQSVWKVGTMQTSIELGVISWHIHRFRQCRRGSFLWLLYL